MGRTYRKRKKKCKNYDTVPENDSSQHTKFMRWSKENGLNLKHLSLRPAIFNDTGRGALTVRNIPKGSVMVSIPENLLINTNVILKSELSETIRRNPKRLDPTQLICLFLVSEKLKEKSSKWYPYIQILPITYSNIAYWNEEEISHLPKWIIPQARENKSKLNKSYKELQSFLIDTKSRHNVTFDDYRWAWSTVNTRAVYWLQTEKKWLKSVSSDCLALAPMLDLLNHSCSTEMTASFNDKNRCYEIITDTPYKRHSQAFISYGPHDNAKLLIEYGFVLPTNPHDAIVYSLYDIVQHYKADDPYLESKKQVIMDNNLQRCLAISMNGMSWNFQLVLRILVATKFEWQTMRSCILQGNRISDENEALVKSVARNIIQFSLEQLPNHQISEAYGEHKRMAAMLCQQYKEILLHCLDEL